MWNRFRLRRARRFSAEENMDVTGHRQTRWAGVVGGEGATRSSRPRNPRDDSRVTGRHVWSTGAAGTNQRCRGGTALEVSAHRWPPGIRPASAVSARWTCGIRTRCGGLAGHRARRRLIELLVHAGG